MNQQEHKAEAERLLARVAEVEAAAQGQAMTPQDLSNLVQSMDRGVATAQVHATLATIPEPRFPFS